VSEAHDLRTALALREGLASLPVPAVSPDFDQRVLGALGRPPWWRAALWSLAPAVPAAACSLAATLALVHWLASRPNPPAESAARFTPAPFVGEEPALGPNLRMGTIHRWPPRGMARAPRPDPADRRSRHVSLPTA